MIKPAKSTLQEAHSFDLHSIASDVDKAIGEAQAKLDAIVAEEHEAKLRLSKVRKLFVKEAYDLEERRKQWKKQVENYDKSIADKDAELNELNESLKTLSVRAEADKQVVAELKQQIENLSHGVRTLNQQRDELDNVIIDLNERIEAETARLNETQEKSNRALKNLTDELQNRQDELKSTEVRLAVIQKEHDDKVLALVNRQNELKDSIKKLTAEDDRLRNVVAHSKDEADAYDQEAQQRHTSLQTRERELEIREKAVADKERAINTQMRRNIY